MKRASLHRKKLMRRSRRQIRQRSRSKKKPERFIDYMLAVKRLPCSAGIVPGHVCDGEIHAHHVGPSGGGMKSHDSLVIALCRGAHRDLHALAGPFREWNKHMRRAFEIGRLLQTQRYLAARGIAPPSITDPEQAAAVARWLSFAEPETNTIPTEPRLAEDLREVGNIDVRYPNTATRPFASVATEGDMRQ